MLSALKVRKAITLFLCLAAMVTAWAVFDPGFNGPDEPIYYAYTAGIVENGDLNPLRHNLPVEDEFVVTPTGNIPDFHNHGAVIVWVPFYLLGKAAAFICGACAPELVFAGRAVRCALSFSTVIMAGLALWLCVRLCLRFGIGMLWAGLSAAAVFFGTPLFFYSLFRTANANIPAFFFSALLLLFLSSWGRFRASHWFCFGLLLSVGAAVKTELWMHLVYIVPFLALLLRRGRLRWTQAALFAGGLLPVLLLRAVNAWFKYGSLHMEETIYFGSILGFGPSYSFNGLWSAYRGIFYTSPLLLLCAAGLVPAVLALFVRGKDATSEEDGREMRILLCLFGLYAALKVWAVSGIFCPGGATLSGRVIIAESPVFILFLALAAERSALRLRLPGRFVLALALSACLLWNFTVIGEYLLGMDWLFIAGRPLAVFERMSMLGNIIAFLFHFSAFRLKVFVSVAVLSAGAVFLLAAFVFRLRTRMDAVGRMAVFSVLCAFGYSLVTAANASNNEENVNALRNAGLLDGARTVAVPALSLSRQEADQHLWTLFEMQRFFALRGDSAAFESVRRLRKAYFGDRDYRQGTFFRPVPPGRELAAVCMHAGRFEMAEIMYGKILDYDPGDVDTLLSLADIYEYTGRPRMAEIMLDRAFAGGAGESYNAAVRLAELYAERGSVNRAIELYEFLTRTSPRSAQYFFALNELYQKKGFSGKAFESCRKAVDLDPLAARYWSELGQIYIRRGAGSKAVECFRRAVSLEPENAVFHAGLGEAQLISGDLDAAQESYLAALKKNPLKAQWHYDLSEVYLRKNDLRSAARSCRKAVAEAPLFAAYWFRLGEIQQDMGIRREAEESMLKAAGIDEANSHYWEALSLLQLQAGRFSAARASSLRAIATAPGDGDLVCALGDVHYLMDDIKEARRIYLRAAGMPGIWQAGAYARAGKVSLRLGEPDAAASHYRKALEFNANSADYHAGLGDIYEIRGRFAEAADSYRRAVELDPFNKGYFVILAGLEKDAGNPDAALSAYGRAAHIAPLDGAVLVLMGNLEQDGNHSGRALEYYVKAAAIPGSWQAGACAAAGRILHRQGKKEQAKDMYRKASGFNPRKSDYFFELAQIYEVDGDLDAAIDAYGRAAALEPFCGQYRLDLAAAQVSDGRLEEGLENMRKAVELDPNNGDGLIVMGELLVRLARFAEAEKVYLKAAGAGSIVRAKAWFAAAQLSQSLGRFDEAEERYLRALECSPNNREYLCDIGFFYADIDRLDEALSCFSRLADMMPESCLYRGFVGEMYARKGMVAAAEKEYRRAVELEPDNCSAYIALGEFLVDAGDSNSALDVFGVAVKRFPGNFSLLLGYADAYLDLEDYDGARRVAVKLRGLGRERLAIELERRIEKQESGEEGGEEGNEEEENGGEESDED